MRVQGPGVQVSEWADAEGRAGDPRRSFVTTTVWEESQVTPQGRIELWLYRF